MSPIHSLPLLLSERPLPLTALLDEIRTECCQGLLQCQLCERVLEDGHGSGC